ncbi:MAG: glycerophosphodiester phosphodiesterase [Desertimonas sp.]
MQQLLPSLLPRPIAFGHRGARAHAPDNTIESFRLALTLGATGIESDVWLTADGVAVLDHDGVVRVGRRRRKIGEVDQGQLPAHVPELARVAALCAEGIHLSLDLKDGAAGPAAIAAVRETAPGLLPRLWLCHPDLDALRALRPVEPSVKLVNSTRLTKIKEGPERRAANLAAAGIDGINLHRTDWNGGLTTLFHRFELTAFGWDLQDDDQLRTGVRMGLDGLYSDHVDRMVDAFKSELGAIPAEL